MKRLLTTVMSLSMAASLALAGYGSALADEGLVLNGTYTAYINGYDWGCAVSKVVVNLDQAVDAVSPEMFTVKESKGATDYASPTFEVRETEFDRQVTAAYLCDENGNAVSEPSRYVAIEMSVDPSTGSPVNYSVPTGYNSWCDPYRLIIQVAEGASLTSAGAPVESLAIADVWAAAVTDADAFAKNSYTSASGITYNYADYKVDGSKNLVVWLHGMGEGGGTERTDPNITCLANKVTALISDEFQQKMGGASVLVPQCPTYWMDSDGQSSNYSSDGIEANGTSYYLESLHELIANYKAEVGAQKVIICGCSNGGYMTMLMALNYGEEYDAYIPICEALRNEYISDEQIQRLKDLNMYFIYSRDDTTVPPEEHEAPTIQRLGAIGAPDIHVATSEHVIDTSGIYANEDGTPHQYAGHWSWIYFDNNESFCDACGISVWDWMAAQLQ